MKVIRNQQFEEERALYNSKDLLLKNCQFKGVLDGESALKESCNITLDSCFMDLRYPLWHTNSICLNNVTMTSNCRAAIWYGVDVKLENCQLFGIKALRECSDSFISDCEIMSPEFGWKCNGITLKDSILKSEYVFLESQNIVIDNLTFEGKYSFQYVKNADIQNSKFITKDAFWHTKDVTVYDSILEGEYLAWYSTNLTLVRCHIKGTQPFCYCKNLKLIDCTMENTDLAFEYSSVDATILGNVESIKNPKSGVIMLDSYNEIILKDSKYPTDCKIKLREKVRV